MDRDTVIALAREAGAEFAELPMTDAIVFSVEDRAWNSAALHRFAALVEKQVEQRMLAAMKLYGSTERENGAAEEREACAKVCEEVCDDPHVVLHVGTVCAAAIRSRT